MYTLSLSNMVIRKRQSSPLWRFDAFCVNSGLDFSGVYIWQIPPAPGKSCCRFFFGPKGKSTLIDGVEELHKIIDTQPYLKTKQHELVFWVFQGEPGQKHPVSRHSARKLVVFLWEIPILG